MSDQLPAISAATAVALRDIKPETAIAIRTSGRDYMVSARDIVEWCAPGAPVGEAKKFLLICQQTGLNPLLGDIDLLPFSGKYMAVVRKNGYLKCARRDPDYDGHESGVTVQRFETTPKNVKVKVGPFLDIPGTCVPDGHLLIGGWCKLYRKGISRPFFKRVSFAEYGKTTPGPWQAIPCTMIEKVAIAHACRESIDLLAATYDESELPVAAPRPVAATVAEQVSDLVALVGKTLPKSPAPQQGAAPAEPRALTMDDGITDEQALDIGLLARKLMLSTEDYNAMLARRGVTKVGDLDRIQAQDIISKLEFHASRLDPVATLLGVSTVEPEATPAPATPEAAPDVIDAEIS